MSASETPPRWTRIAVAEYERLQRVDALLQSILRNSPFLISTKDLEGVVTLANARFAVLDAPPPEQLVGRSVFELFPPEVAAALWANDLLAVRENRAIETEEVVAHKDGSQHVYFTVKFPIHDPQGRISGICALSVDITEAKRAQQLSITDELTGVGNRRSLHERFGIELLRARRYGERLNLALIDIDHFKAFNDHHGHAQGDQVLRLVAQTLKRTLSRAGDLLFRVGGEEFVALFATADDPGAALLAQELRQAVENLRLPQSGLGAGRWVTISVGLATLIEGVEHEFESVFRRADAALYRAKAAGRNRVERASA